MTFVDLFAGCGGMAWGFRRAGFEPVGAVEIDVDAAWTYAQNVDERIQPMDIAWVNKHDLLPEADIVIGGPPCQGFSQLGTRDPSDPRNNLWQEYVRVLDSSRARFFVMENVPQLLRSQEFAQFTKAVTSRSRGFRIAYGVLSAADFGVPQLRSRAIVFGWKDGEPILPTPTHGPKSKTGKPHMTVREAFSGLPLKPDERNWHNSRQGLRDFSITRYKAVPPDGGNRFEMQAELDRRHLGDLVPPCWRRKQSGTTDVFGRLWWDRPASTIRTEFYKPEKGRYLHPSAHRPITVREAARLQSFPDRFRFSSTQSVVSVARQIGNAVPPTLAAALGTSIRKQLSSEDASRDRASSRLELRRAG